MIHRLPSRSATAPVVPLPQKKSATKSPSFEEAFKSLFKSAVGFCVAKSVRSSEDWFSIGKKNESLARIIRESEEI
jgi:hypothetical protein